MIVVRQRHLKTASEAGLKAYADLAIKMIRGGWFFHEGWQIGVEFYDDHGIIRRRLRPIPPDHVYRR